MKTRNEVAKEIAEFVMSQLKSAGIESLCVGGLPRDISLGGTVDDADIVVSHEIEGIYSTLDKIYEVFDRYQTRDKLEIPHVRTYQLESFLKYPDEDDGFVGETSGDDLPEDSDFQSRIDWVLRITPEFIEPDDDEDGEFLVMMDEFKIDILAAKCSTDNKDLLSFLDTFDFTLNRWAMDHTGFITCYMPFGEKTVRPLDGFKSRIRMNRRYQHLKRKYPNHPLVDWSELEASGKVNVLSIPNALPLPHQPDPENLPRSLPPETP